MAVQARLDISTVPFVRFGLPAAQEVGQTLLQDGGRSGNIVEGTLMAFIIASSKWETYTDETATDGTAIPAGFYIGDDILEADIISGDVEDLHILTGAAFIDETQITIEGGKTLATVIATGTVNARTVRQALRQLALFAELTDDASSFEN